MPGVWRMLDEKGVFLTASEVMDGGVASPGVQTPPELLEALGQNSLSRSANQKEAVKEELNHQALIRKGIL